LKQGGQTWVSRNSSGFTLIEVMVGILIMVATSATMFYGINYARAQARKTIMQQRALEELRSEMDYWMVRLMDGQVDDHDLGGDMRGTEVILYNPDSNLDEDEEYFRAIIYRKPTHKEYRHDHDPNRDSPFYKLEMYIQWRDHLGDVNGEPMELRMQYSVFTQ